MSKIRTSVKKFARSAYHRLPISYAIKVRMKNQFYKSFSFILRDTYMYKVWSNSNEITERIPVTVDESAIDTKTYYINDLFSRAAGQDPEYVPFTEVPYDFNEDDVKLIAFYLPQFHAIPENDLWWGKGFTEWTNVTKAVPQFRGHYQPHLPGELGFYDLKLVENMKAQIDLAKHYGVHGFCFYHYWFDGKRLLERPVDQFIENKDLDFPFCLCWANENWSRRWDGQDHEILIKQNHSDHDDLEFIKDLCRYLKDYRYIKVNGKPLVIIYRPALLPNFIKTAEIWRQYSRENGIGEIFILGVSWGITHPTQYGLDGLVEFPPHCIHEYGSDLINDQIEILNPEFNGLIYDLKSFVDQEKYLFDVDYKLFKTVSPSWDNTARKPNNGTIYHNSSPEVYKKWLKNVIRYTNKNLKEEKIVFINAWNEWAEGAHLEPDRKYGYGYLEETKNALIETRTEKQRKIVYVSHDLHFNGAQLLSLNIVKTLKKDFGYTIEIFSLNSGKLQNEFEKYGNVNIVSDINKANKRIMQLSNEDFSIAICNTVLTGEYTEILSKNGFRVISLIHELPGVIKQYSAVQKAEKISEYADKIIFPAKFVSEKFQTIAVVPENKSLIQPQGLYNKNPYKNNNFAARKILLEKLGLPQKSKIVLGVGFADKRKGIDLFAEVATMIRTSKENIYFVWVGDLEPNFLESIPYEYKKNVIFVEATKDIGVYYAGTDIYLLTSREDPFPSVILEAMDVNTPVVGFKEAGGFCDIISDETGALAEYLNVNDMVKNVMVMLEDEKVYKEKSEKCSLLIEECFNFLDYVYYLLSQLGHNYKKISVIVPSYNYEKYLTGRLESIVKQTYPIYEVIFLDDCSKDNSVELARSLLSKEDKSFKLKIIENTINSGSVFAQWSKGISLATGDYLWIAEADDLASLNFLEEVVKGFYLESNTTIAYSQSKQIDENGKITAENYLEYTSEVDFDKWKNTYIADGIDEIKNRLSVKNTIPNVSAVLFKKNDISELKSELLNYKIAGDWFFYISLLEKGNIYFCHKSLNLHRRHTSSVTKSENNLLHYNEVVKIQDSITLKFGVDKSIIEKVNKYRIFLKKYLEI